MYVYTAHIKGPSQLTTVWVLFCTFHRSDLVSVFRLMLENVWGRRDRVQSVFDDVVNLLMVPLGFFFESPDWKIDILYLIGELSAILTKNEQCSQNDCNNEPQKANNGNHPGVIEYQNGIGLIAGGCHSWHSSHHQPSRECRPDSWLWAKLIWLPQSRSGLRPIREKSLSLPVRYSTAADRGVGATIPRQFWFVFLLFWIRQYSSYILF